MQNYHILKEVDIKDTFKNDVLKGLFEIDMQKIITEKNHTLHFDEFDFNIGCIIGTSGSGKTQLAREISIQNNIPLIEKNTWNDDSLISNFDCEVKEAVTFLSKIGLNTQLSYLKPYHILSNGEKFRADLALSLFNNDYVIIDEFTSLVDRQVAKVCCISVAKLIKKYNKKVIFVSCHNDFLEWLQPCWVYNLNTQEFKNTKDLLWQREKLQFHITRGESKHWSMFKEFHYLSHSFNKACNNIFLLHFKSYIIGFCAFLNMPNNKGKFMRVHRIVIHPDFQGLNLGTLFLKECCQLIKEKYKGFHIILNTGLKSFAFALKKDKDFICYHNSYSSSLNLRFTTLNKHKKIKYISFKYIGK